VDHLYIVREDKRDNKSNIEANDSISLFNDICYIYIGDETFTSVGETLAPVSEVFRSVHWNVQTHSNICLFKWTQFVLQHSPLNISTYIYLMSNSFKNPVGKIWGVYSYIILQNPSEKMKVSILDMLWKLLQPSGTN
jgi:hypothetical protein